MNFCWEVGIGYTILGLSIILLIDALLIIFVCHISRRQLPLIVTFSCVIASIVCFIFCLEIPSILVGILMAITSILVVNSNPGDANKFLANPFKTPVTKSGKFGVEKIFDSNELYRIVNTAVLNLAASKTGALITFERTKSLKNFSKNGVVINAPVSAELLQTIFYPGTRLHDGAVIIHGNQIVAAAVFFVLSTQTFAVKYGSRHRAAIGISEVSDAITIIVSEETGRISIATNGQIEPVEPDNFLRVFENYMSDNSGDEE